MSCSECLTRDAPDCWILISSTGVDPTTVVLGLIQATNLVSKITFCVPCKKDKDKLHILKP